MAKNAGFGAFHLGGWNFSGRLADGFGDGAHLPHVPCAVLAHHQVQPDLKLPQTARCPIFVSRNEANNFRASHVPLSLL
jgi:hypothetical protein